MLRKIRFSAMTLITATMMAFLMTACHTARKFAETGDYDGAIEFCVQKLQGKKKKKTEYVQGLEAAFVKAQERDLNRIEALNAEKMPENWEKVNDIHKKIAKRQRLIEPLMPLRSSDGYYAEFDMLNIGKMESESTLKAAEYYYTRAENYMTEARKGDKMAARNAMYLLRQIEKKFLSTYRDKDRLKQEALVLGKSHILFEVKNHSNKIMPRGLSERVLAMNKHELDSEWRSFYFDESARKDFDYRVVFKVHTIDVSPERVREREYTDEKDIQEGWAYKYDKSGNVMKDTAGNDIKTARMVRIRAVVLETMQTKAANLGGSIEIYDAAKRALLDTRNVGSEVFFENYASTFVGDQRALSPETKSRIGNRPVPFPRDEDLILQTADKIKPTVKNELLCTKAIL